MTESFGQTVIQTGAMIADKLNEASRKKKYKAAVELENAKKAREENDSEINRTWEEQAQANFDTANRNAAAGAASAISQLLYEKTPDKLTQEEKLTVSTLSQAAASITGGTLANNSDGAIIAAKTAKDAVENNAQAPIFGNVTPDINSYGEGQIAKSEMDKSVLALIQKEHPIIYQTAEGTYYFVSAAGKAVYVSREIMMTIGPMLAAPELVAGKVAYKVTSQVALGLAANAGAQIASGQPFNWYEFAGAGASAVISPKLKTTNDVIRVNMGIGMATGLASGSDPIEGAGLAGSAAYVGSKVQNPIVSLATSEMIQKIPNMFKTKQEGEKVGENK